MDIRRCLIALCVLFNLSVFSLFALAADEGANASTDSTTKSAESQVFKDAEALKKELIDLNRELYLFEEELLYPANSQLAVFLSIEGKSAFVLDSIELQLDGKLITSHLYKENEVTALKRGGVQRIYIGSLSDGKHKLTAKFNGLGANNRYFRRSKGLKFTKQNSAKYIQLIVTSSGSSREPLFKVKQW